MRLMVGEDELSFPMGNARREKIGDEEYLLVDPVALLAALDEDELADLVRAMWNTYGPDHIQALLVQAEDFETTDVDEYSLGAGTPRPFMDTEGDLHAHPTDAYRKD